MPVVVSPKPIPEKGQLKESEKIESDKNEDEKICDEKKLGDLNKVGIFSFYIFQIVDENFEPGTGYFQ